MKNLSKSTRVLLISLAGVLVLAAGFFIFRTPADAPLTADPTPEPPSTLEVVAGDEVLVTITADAVENMYGYQFQLHYDPAELSYTENDITSEISDFSWIFDTTYDSYALIGATMTGDQTGLSGTDQVLCHLKFTMLRDCVLTEELFSLSDVRVVHTSETAESGLEDERDVTGWSCSFSLA